MTFESFLARIKSVSRNGSTATGLCPAHDDHHPSLSVTLKDGRLLVHCFAGCEVTAIVTALKLITADLFINPQAQTPHSHRLTLETFAEAKGLPLDFLRAEGVERDGPAIRITYRLADGSLAPRQRRRTALRAGDGSTWYRGHGKPVPYGLQDHAQARERGFLLLVEGETRS